MAFGSMMGATLMHSWLYVFYADLFGHGKLQATQIFAMVIMDVFFMMPYLYLPVFYCVKEFAYATNDRLGRGKFDDETDDRTGKMSNASSPRQLMRQALQKWHANVQKDIELCVCVIVPMDILVFASLPAHWRTTGMASVGLLWVVALSLSRGGRSPVEEGETERLVGRRPSDGAI